MTKPRPYSSRQRFNRIALGYHRAAVLQHEIAQRLIERLALMKIDPQHVLELGARTGYNTSQLKQRYPKAQLIAADLSDKLLAQQRRLGWRRRKTSRVCVDYVALPFQAQCFDLIFSNLALHWSANQVASIKEWQRLLKPNGLLLFSTLGPDTFKELRAANFMASTFCDMHDIGDWLLKAGFVDPVMDRQNLQLRYDSLSNFFADLKKSGVNLSKLGAGLQGKNAWKQQCNDYQQQFGLTASVEIVFGHAWGAQQNIQQGEVVVPMSAIGKKPE